jgi:hypothetical protein
MKQEFCRVSHAERKPSLSPAKRLGEKRRETDRRKGRARRE